MLAWVAGGGIVTAALLAVATAAIALGLAAIALAILALVLRQLWRDLRGKNWPRFSASQRPRAPGTFGPKG